MWSSHCSRLTILFVLCIPTCIFGQTKPQTLVEEDTKLKQVAESTIEKFKLPGVSIAIVDGNHHIRIAAAGVRKAGAQAKITIHDRFHLGSCTKAMTATVAACVVRDTKLEWDSTIEDALPKLAKQCHDDFKKATLRQLLDHRSGLAANSIFMRTVDANKSPTEQRRQLFRILLIAKPNYEPGTRYVYSNLGFMLAALMAETASGRSWRDLMKRYLFEPLKMESAGFGPPATKDQADQPWGHYRRGEKLIPTGIDNPPVLGPAGRVHCSLSDWARFAALHLGHSPSLASKTQDAESKAALTADADMIKFLHRPLEDNNYTFGWIVTERPWAGGRALSHSGSNTVWFATVWIAPGKDRAYLVATNTGQKNARQALDSAVVEMIALTASEK